MCVCTCASAGCSVCTSAEAERDQDIHAFHQAPCRHGGMLIVGRRGGMSIRDRHGGTSIVGRHGGTSIVVVYEVSLLLVWCYCCMCVLSVVLLYEVVCVTNIGVAYQSFMGHATCTTPPYFNCQCTCN